MRFTSRYSNLIALAVGIVFMLFAASGRAQDNRERTDEFDPSGVLRRFRFRLCDTGMTSIDPPSGHTDSQTQRTFLGSERTAWGTIIERYSDGSTVEFRRDAKIETFRDRTMIYTIIQDKPEPKLLSSERTPKDTNIERYSDGTTVEFGGGRRTETLRDGTKIEKVIDADTGNRTTTVTWPDGRGFIVYPDGTGAKIESDGSIVETEGTIEVLPGGVIRQTLKDDGTILDRFPDGTVRSRPDLVKGKKQTSSTMEPFRRTRSCNEALLDGVLRADAQTAGVPKPMREVAQVEHKKPGLFESLIPVLIPSVSIGIGGGKHREREHPHVRR